MLFHNIEKLKHKDHYTGYASGAIYRIRRAPHPSKSGPAWRAHYVGFDQPVNTPLWFYERTLREVSAMLDRIADARINAGKPLTGFNPVALPKETA